MTTTSSRMLWFALAGASTLACGQSAIDLRSQAKNPDLSAAPFTRIFKTGTTLPANCLPGDSFFKTDAVPGSNLFGCTSTDTWSSLGTSFDAGTGIQLLGSMISIDDAVVPFYYVGSGAPAIPCQAGRDHYVDTTNRKVYLCIGPDVWGELARLDKANIYAAGQKQTFGSSPDSAGMNVGAVTGDPNTVEDGDIWYNIQSGRFRCREGGVSKDCLGSGLGQPYGMQGLLSAVRDSDWSDLNMGAGAEKICAPNCSTPGRVSVKSGDLPAALYGRKIPVPTSDYVRTFTILPLPDSHQFASVGVGWYSTDTGKLTVCSLVRDASTAGELEVKAGYYNSMSLFNMWAPAPGFTVPAAQPVSFRLSLLNGTRKCEVSLDNVIWYPLLSVPNNFLHTPDHFAYTVSGSDPSRQSRIVLISYQ